MEEGYIELLKSHKNVLRDACPAARHRSGKWVERDFEDHRLCSLAKENLFQNKGLDEYVGSEA